MDALYSSHNIEHVFAHEVVPTLKEFRRVLKPDGFVVITGDLFRPDRVRITLRTGLSV
jgi:predicted SAM-dependent methyltransferase